MEAFEVKYMCLVSLFLIRGTSAAVTEPCVLKHTDLSPACPPCNKENWLDMVKNNEQISNAEKSCYNNDPITKYYISEESISDGSSVVATGEYKITNNHGPREFLLRKEPFFRFAFLSQSPTSPTPPPAVDDAYFDLNRVKKYFKRKDSTGADLDADFQLLEWPGATAEQMHSKLNKNDKDAGHSSCDLYSNTIDCKDRQWMLQFERYNGKILYYACNAEDGTSIAAIGSLLKINETEVQKEKDSIQKLWLVHGNESVFHHYVQPLYVPQYVLEKMAKSEGTRCTKDEYLWDLRTVKDFTFTRNRLILGMKCGILSIKNLASNNLTGSFEVASLWSETGLGYNLFPEEINKVSSTTCCFGPVVCGTDGGIVAAYSFNQTKQSDENKFIYVSFNFGDTFEKKIIASQHSPINLIKAMYKLYSRWHDYYEILHNPDDDDLEDDEDDGDGLLKNLRAKVSWHSSTTEDREKQFSFGTAKGKKMATLKKIVKILEHRVPKRRMRRGNEDIDVTPEWVNAILKKIHKENNWLESWNEENCTDPKKCEVDKAVEWLLGEGGIHIMTPTRSQNEPFCKEITSMLLVAEERLILALCQVGYEEVGSAAAPAPPPSSSPDSGYFAIYKFPIKENIPLIYGQRVSERIFKCNFINNTLNEPEFTVQPEIVRIQGTSTILVINCEGVVYISTNFGSTLFNVAFYYEQAIMDKYCGTKHTSSAANGECEESNRPPNQTPIYLRTFNLCALDVPPMLAADSSGFRLLITFGKFYALGAIAYNRETRLVVGEVLPELAPDRRFENLLFPAVDKQGEPVLSISLAEAYSIPDSAFQNKLYKNRHALRLVQMPLPYNQDSRNYDNANLAMCQLAKDKKLGFPVCQTSSYSIYPKRLDLDLGDKLYVQVEVVDEDYNLPLWIYSSNQHSLDVQAFHSLREGSPIPNLNVHNWKIEVIARPNNKSEEYGESLIDAFFASDYNKLKEFSTQLAFINKPNSRCHVRPTSTIDVQISCRGKKMIAHEDKYRPQCKQFRNNFNYTIPNGRYDPELVNQWVATSSNQSRPFYRMNPEGDLVVTYDYAFWGCPLEPFAADRFIPDLRIIDTNTENDTTTVTPFKGEFILIVISGCYAVEIFGTLGFSYTKRVADMKCTRPPQRFSEQVNHWKQRQRLFYVAAERLQFPQNESDLNKTAKPFEMIKGQKILKNNEVMKHINIWNRANYLSCHEGEPEYISENVEEREYEVMKTRDEDDEDSEYDEAEEEEFEEQDENAELAREHALNEIAWGKDHPRVLLFLAVAVDEYGSLCEYQTLFGVSLKTSPDMDDLQSFLIYLFFVILWFTLVLGGYNVRKRYLRLSHKTAAKNKRLERAAWQIIGRYEKLIHGNTMDTMFNVGKGGDGKTGDSASKMNVADRRVHDKRRAELHRKKADMMAQEEARLERLQKLFRKY